MRTFIAASSKMEAAYLAKSKAAERRVHRIQALVWALLIAVTIGLVGWINQSFLKEQWRWYTVTRPYINAEVTPYVLTSTAEATLKPGDSFKECLKDCPEMIVVPAGSFTMGSPPSETGRTKREDPQHLVTIGRPFAVSKYEVTFADWDACVAFGNCDPHKIESRFGRGRQPVGDVGWYHAKQYVAWLSQMTGKHYRLLSEAEYEYAARAGTQTIYPWGDDIGQNNANCEGCSSQWDGKPAPVGSFPPNHFGLYDMVSNVWEWVEDCWHVDYDGAPVDGSPWIEDDNCNFRVERGDGWVDSPTPQLPRSALRDKDPPGSLEADVGFRVARTLE